MPFAEGTTTRNVQHRLASVHPAARSLAAPDIRKLTGGFVPDLSPRAVQATARALGELRRKELVDKVNREIERRKHMEQVAANVPSLRPALQAQGFTPVDAQANVLSALSKVPGQLAEAAVGAPAGLAMLGGAVVHDTLKASPLDNLFGATDLDNQIARGIGTGVKYSPLGLAAAAGWKAAPDAVTDRVGGFAGGVGAAAAAPWNAQANGGGYMLDDVGRGLLAGMKETYSNPSDNLGYIMLDLLALGSMGAGAVGRVGAASRAMEAAKLAGTRSPTRAGLERLVLGPPPETAQLRLRGQEFRETDPVSGEEFSYTTPDMVVEKLVSRNQLFAPIQRARAQRLQNALDRGAYEAPTDTRFQRATAPLRNAAAERFGAEAVFGRELRAHRRVNEEADTALLADLRHSIGSTASDEIPQLDRLPKSLRKGLTRGQNKLLQLVSWHGDRALDDPLGVIEQEMQAHARHVQLPGVEPEHKGRGIDHVRHMADLVQARKAAETAGQDERFLRVLRLQREASMRREQGLVERGLMTPEGMKWRKSVPAAVQRGEQLTEEVPTGDFAVVRGKQTPRDSQSRQNAYQEIAAITETEGQIAKLTQAFEKSKQRTRPRTVEEAVARRDELQALKDKAVETLRQEHGHPDYPDRKALQAAMLKGNQQRALVGHFQRLESLKERGYSVRDAKIEIGKDVDVTKLRGSRKRGYDRLVRQGASQQDLWFFLGNRSMRGLSHALRAKNPDLMGQMRSHAEKMLYEVADRQPTIKAALDELDRLNSGLRSFDAKKRRLDDDKDAEIAAVFGREGEPERLRAIRDERRDVERQLSAKKREQEQPLPAESQQSAGTPEAPAAAADDFERPPLSDVESITHADDATAYLNSVNEHLGKLQIRESRAKGAEQEALALERLKLEGVRMQANRILARAKLSKSKKPGKLPDALQLDDDGLLRLTMDEAYRALTENPQLPPTASIHLARLVTRAREAVGDMLYPVHHELPKGLQSWLKKKHDHIGESPQWVLDAIEKKGTPNPEEAMALARLLEQYAGFHGQNKAVTKQLQTTMRNHAAQLRKKADQAMTSGREMTDMIGPAKSTKPGSAIAAGDELVVPGTETAYRVASVDKDGAHLDNGMVVGLNPERAYEVRPRAEPAPTKEGAVPELHPEQLDVDETARIARADEIAALELRLKELAAEERGIRNPPPRRVSAADQAELLGSVPVGPDERLGTRASGLKDRLEQLYAQFGRRQPPQQEVRFEPVTETRRRDLGEPPEGSFYTPISSARPDEPVGKYTAPTPGPHGVGPVNAGRYDTSLTHEITGDSIRMGKFRTDAPMLTVESGAKAVRLFSALDTYSDLWQRSAPVRRSKYDVPIRSARNIPQTLRDLIARGDENLPITADEIAELNQQMLGALEKHLHPEEYANAPINTDLSGKGIRWIDRRVLDALRPNFEPPRGGLIKAADAINNPARLFYVYGRAAYILNLPGNMGMQAITQGLFAPRNYRMALNAEKLWDEETYRVASAIVGEGRARATSVNSGFLGKPTQAAAQFWSNFIDRHSRISSLIHEMRREGIDVNDPAAVRKFVTTPSTKRTAVARRANKAMVEFNNLTDGERNTIRHLIFLYPWMSRATVWAFRTAIEHPVKTWTLAELAREGVRKQNEEVGELPGYLAQRGYFSTKVAGINKDMLINPTSINTFSTAADNGRILLGLAIGGTRVSGGDARGAREALSPAFDALVGTVTGESSRGKPYEGGTVTGALKEMVEAAPEWQLLRRAGLVDPEEAGKPLHQRRVLSGGNPGYESVAPFLIGGLAPRTYDPEVAAARVRKEKREKMSLDKREEATVTELASTMLTEARRLGYYGPTETWDPGLQDAFRLYRERRTAYGRAAEKMDIPLQRLGQRQRLEIDLQLLQREGILTAADVADELANARVLTDEQVKNVRRELADDLFDMASITDLKAELRDQGAVLPG